MPYQVGNGNSERPTKGAAFSALGRGLTAAAMQAAPGARAKKRKKKYVKETAEAGARRGYRAANVAARTFLGR